MPREANREEPAADLQGTRRVSPWAAREIPLSVKRPSAPPPCMYVLTIRDGLQTRHVGPYTTPQLAAQDVDRVLARYGERVHWQIHELDPPSTLLLDQRTPTTKRVAAA